MLDVRKIPENRLPSHLQSINVMKAWQADARGSEAGIAIIDSGIDMRESYARKHLNDLKSDQEGGPDKRVYKGGVFLSPGASQNLFDEYGHGTKIASIVGARPGFVAKYGYSGVVGIVPETVRMFNYKVVDQSGHTSPDSVKRAVKAIVNKRGGKVIRIALFALDAKVWEDDIQIAKEVFKMLHEKNILSIVAASDTAPEGRDLAEVDEHPANFGFSSVLVVAAHDREGGVDKLTPDTNYGANHVHLVAPGRHVACAAPLAPSISHGTSAAAAIVAGAAALLLSKNLNKEAAWVHDKLCQLTRNIKPENGRAVMTGALDLTNITDFLQ